MVRNPFHILEPLTKNLTVAMFTKEDDIQSDTQAGEAFNLSKTAGLHQVHGNRVIIVREERNRSDEADGMITDKKNLLLCIRWADCQNFVVYAPKKNIAGIMHVGWKGLIAGTIPSFFELLKKEFDIDAKDTFVFAGPSLCKNCSEFSDPKNELPGLPINLLHGKNADLQGWADHQLFELGLKKENAERHPDCTKCNPEKYWTYRGGHREEVKQGHTNMMTVALR